VDESVADQIKIVMEYAGGKSLKPFNLLLGGTLQQYVNKCVEESQIINWFTQICQGMKHFHDKNVIHRDLKPDNIFLTSKGKVKIGDFGLAKVLSDFSILSIKGAGGVQSPEM
jgi:NIMA (never in mitosis gene a)-related kinase